MFPRNDIFYFSESNVGSYHSLDAKKVRNSKNDPIFTISVETRELQPFHWSAKKSAPRLFLVALKKCYLNTLSWAVCVIFCTFLDVKGRAFQKWPQNYCTCLSLQSGANFPEIAVGYGSPGIIFFRFGGILGSASRAELSNLVGFTPRLLYSSTHHSSESTRYIYIYIYIYSCLMQGSCHEPPENVLMVTLITFFELMIKEWHSARGPGKFFNKVFFPIFNFFVLQNILQGKPGRRAAPGAGRPRV